MVEMIVIGRHAVHGSDGAQGADEIIGSGIAHHADRLDGEEDGEGLPDGIIKARIANFFQVNRVGLAQNFQLFRCNFTRHTNGQTRPREGVAFDKVFGHTQRAAKVAHLVFEQLAQRFHQLQFHMFGQAANIVVGFNGHRWAAGK